MEKLNGTNRLRVNQKFRRNDCRKDNRQQLIKGESGLTKMAQGQAKLHKAEKHKWHKARNKVKA